MKRNRKPVLFFLHFTQGAVVILGGKSNVLAEPAWRHKRIGRLFVWKLDLSQDQRSQITSEKIQFDREFAAEGDHIPFFCDQMSVDLRF